MSSVIYHDTKYRMFSNNLMDFALLVLHLKWADENKKTAFNEDRQKIRNQHERSKKLKRYKIPR